MTQAIDLGVCRNIDFHFNKGSIGNPDIPKWVIKAKGQTHYIHHIDANVAWSTRELAEGSTLGMIRFKRAHVVIDENGVATLTEPELEPA